MSFPDVATEFETFFEPTRIWLFGKRFTSIEYKRDTMSREWSDYKAPAPTTDLPMPPRRIERALRRQAIHWTGNQVDEVISPIFARIYSFSFEGNYYNLPRPLLFLVTGPGTKPTTKLRHPERDFSASERQRAFETKFTGLEAKDWNFADDICVWAVDKRDLAVCLDVEVGPYQEILLDSMIAYEEDMAGRRSGGSRGSFASRGSMSFRGSMIGPHQNR